MTVTSGGSMGRGRSAILVSRGPTTGAPTRTPRTARPPSRCSSRPTTCRHCSLSITATTTRALCHGQRHTRSRSRHSRAAPGPCWTRTRIWCLAWDCPSEPLQSELRITSAVRTEDHRWQVTGLQRNSFREDSPSLWITNSSVVTSEGRHLMALGDAAESSPQTQ